MYIFYDRKTVVGFDKSWWYIERTAGKMPAVKLQLSDGTMYDAEGKIDAVSGVIDQTTGSVSMRAISRTSKIFYVVEVWQMLYSLMQWIILF